MPKTSQAAVGMSARAGEVAHLVGGELAGDPTVELTGFGALDEAGPGDLTFCRSGEFASAWDRSQASAVLVTRGVTLTQRPGTAIITVDDADLAMTALLSAMEPRPSDPEPGVHPQATVDDDASIDPSASIGPGCVVAAGATVGPRCRLIANVYVGEHASVGPDTVLHPGVVIEHRCRVGARCVLHANVVVGADGFGYRPSHDGRSLVRLPHMHAVVIDDDVEIGACTCVDRGKLRDTRIGAGTKIDNLVQIGHSVQVGRMCILCGLSAIAGSATLGDGVTMGGRAGVLEGVRVGHGATIAANSAPAANVPAETTMAGFPAVEASRYARNAVAMRNLGEMFAELRKLRKKVDRLEADRLQSDRAEPTP